MDTSSYSKKTLDVDNRSFLVQLVRFDNATFVSISEGAQNLGAMVVSIGTNPGPTTATVIPAKTDSLFLKLLSEKISTYVNGISIVSLFTQKELGSDVAKTLMSKILEMVRTDRS